MASLGEYCTRNCPYSKNSFNILSIFQPCNARQFRRSVVTKQLSTRPTFCPLSTGGKMLLINIIQKRKEDQWRLWCTDDGSCGIAPLPPPIPSASNLIHEFYTAINTKNSEELNENLDPLLSEDCVYQDLFFYIPFQGKKDVKSFLCNVMEAMGHNICAVVKSVSEGENYYATVIWHLEWNKKEIPFTTGCQFFECEEVEGKLLIRKITGVQELPVKPGDFILKLLKATSTTFDLHPGLAEGLLQLMANGTHDGLEKFLALLGWKH
ncbi:hypothetical protein ACB098_01G118100 [Castanea mollissima]